MLIRLYFYIEMKGRIGLFWFGCCGFFSNVFSSFFAGISLRCHGGRRVRPKSVSRGYEWILHRWRQRELSLRPGRMWDATVVHIHRFVRLRVFFLTHFSHSLFNRLFSHLFSYLLLILLDFNFYLLLLSLHCFAEPPTLLYVVRSTTEVTLSALRTHLILYADLKMKEFLLLDTWTGQKVRLIIIDWFVTAYDVIISVVDTRVGAENERSRRTAGSHWRECPVDTV